MSVLLTARIRSFRSSCFAIVLLLLGAALLNSEAASAQGADRAMRTGTKAWLAGGIGIDPSSALAAEWEGWIAHGLLAVGYRTSYTEGQSIGKHAHALLAGLVFPVGSLKATLAAGAGPATACVHHGEQAGTTVCSTTSAAPAAGATLDLPFSPTLGAHVSYLSMFGRPNGHSAFVIGLALGKLR